MKKQDRKGFTLVEIMIVVAIIALLAAIAIPSFMKSRQSVRLSMCINTLRLIDHAKQEWGTANNAVDSAAPNLTTDIGPYLKSAPLCPSGGSYTVGAMTNAPTCSKSAAPDFHVLP